MLTIQIPASELPTHGDPAIFDSYVMHTLRDVEQMQINAIELDLERSRLKKKLALAEDREVKAGLLAIHASDASDILRLQLDDLRLQLSTAQAAVTKDPLAPAQVKQLEAKLKKAESQAKQEAATAKSRSERIQKQQKEIKKLAGEVSVLKKQLTDARKRFARDYVDQSKPTITIGNRQIVVQFHDQQVHVYDPANHCVVSSQPLPSEDDYAPRFTGYTYRALLDNHYKIKPQIEEAINALAMSYRKSIGKTLTADIRSGVNPAHLKKLWNAGVMFAADLEKPEVIAQVKELRGIGPKTLDKILAGAKAAASK